MSHTLSVTAANKLTVEKFVLYTNIIYNIHFYLYIYLYIYVYTLVFSLLCVCNSPPSPLPRYITVRSISFGAWYNAYNSLCIELSMRKWHVWTIRYSRTSFLSTVRARKIAHNTCVYTYRHILAPFVHCFVFLIYTHTHTHTHTHSLSLSLSRTRARARAAQNESRRKHTSIRTHTHSLFMEE